MQRVEVVVDVATLKLGSRSNLRTVLMMVETRNGHEANSFHVTTTFETVGNLVVFVVIPDMGMTTEESDRSVPSYAADSLVDGIKLVRVGDRDMSSNDEKVNVLLANSVLEPVFLDSIPYSLDDGVVRITLKVEEEAESHDPDTLVLGSKLSVPLCKRLKLSGFWVIDVQVGSDIGLLEVRHSVVVLIVGRVLLIEFVVTRSDDVYFLVFEDVEGILSFGI